MQNSDMWIATAEDEYNDIRRLGYRQPVAVIPNGVEIPTDIPVKKSECRRMFFISRIHPKKNVAMLLRCWSRLAVKFPEWHLSIVGPCTNNQYADEMKEYAEFLQCSRLTFEGELRGAEKNLFMASSECEILPTYSENFGMVVAESLACGTPVICSQGAPWKGLIDNKCGWWISLKEDALEETMQHVMSMSREDLKKMGENGREWMKRDFDWCAISLKLKLAYEWLLHKDSLNPDWIIVD